MFWCDKVTGLSSNFWLRALGWYAMALIDTMEVMPEETLGSEKKEMNRIYKELIDSMLPYQDEETGMWYQVVNRGGIHPNYLETSGSAIFAYAIMKSVRLGFLDGSYFAYGKKASVALTFLKKTENCNWAGSVLWQDLEIKKCGKEPLIIICANRSLKMRRKALHR